MLRGESFEPPETLYVGLFASSPQLEEIEVGAGSYRRMAVKLTQPEGGSASNSAIITFPTALEDWGTIVAAGLFDAIKEGNLLMWTDLENPQPVNDGSTFRFNVGALQVRVN